MSQAHAKILVYVTQTCPFCTMARRLFDGKGLQYEIIDIGGDWELLNEKTGRRTVPQVYIGQHHVGGFDDLSAADASGQLDQLLVSND